MRTPLAAQSRRIMEMNESHGIINEVYNEGATEEKCKVQSLKESV